MNLSDLTIILIATVVNVVIGFFWYAPFSFAPLWVKEAGFTPEMLEKGKNDKSIMMRGLSSTIVASILMALVLLQMIRGPGMETLPQMLQVVFWTWLAFVAAIRMSHSMFEQRSFTYNAILSGHDLLSMLVMSLILWFMR